MNASPRRIGFTLIEVLIALGLTVVLVSAVYGAIDMYYRFQTAGRAEIRGQQMLRALTRIIAQDIGCVVLRLPEPETSLETGGQAADEVGTSTESDSGSTTSTSSSTFGGTNFSGSSFDAAASGAAAGNATTGTILSFSGLKDSGLPVVFGVVGTEALLHLTVSIPSRDLNYFDVSQQTVEEQRTGDLQIITIGLTQIDDINMAALQKNLQVSRPTVGLGRRIRDLYSQVAGEEELESKHLLAPEVTEMSFRYFDSDQWYASWDSSAMGRLPRAIEVDFGFWNPPPIEVGVQKSLKAGTVTHVQYVFNVPSSSPADALGLE